MGVDLVNIFILAILIGKKMKPCFTLDFFNCEEKNKFILNRFYCLALIEK